jgi:hypothetical protein
MSDLTQTGTDFAKRRCAILWTVHGKMCHHTIAFFEVLDGWSGCNGSAGAVTGGDNRVGKREAEFSLPTSSIFL